MQVLFSNSMSGKEGAGDVEAILLRRIENTKQLYFVYLQYMIDVCQYALVDAAKRASKHIQDERDLNVNTDLANNSCIVSISSSDKFKKLVKNYKPSSFVDSKLVRELFKKLEASEKYVKYCEIEERTKADEIDILRYIAKKIIGASQALDEHLSEYFMGLEDDHFITLHSLQKKLKNYPEMEVEAFLDDFLLGLEDTEEVEYAKSLIDNFLSNKRELDEIIEPRLKNWDMDRVALMDVILIKLAIVEFLYCPYIPLKVSMNEYIDISKEYSTSKSKDFINGILDKVMKNLKEEGKIKKLGRGLINN